MRRTPALLALVPLALALSACGGDDGDDNEAFCEIVEELADEGDTPSAEQVEELADAAPADIQEQIELLNEVLEAVEDDDAEALEELAEDADEIDEAAEDVEDFTEEECDVDLDTSLEGDGGNGGEEEAEDEQADEDEDAEQASDFCGIAEELQSTSEPTAQQVAAFAEAAPDGDIAADILVLAEAIAAFEEDPESVTEEDFEELDEVGTRVSEFVLDECGIDLDETTEEVEEDIETDDTIGDGGDVEAGDAQPAPELDDPEEQSLADACEGGDMGSCDELFFVTDIGSVGETYGATCGGRASEDLAGQCEATFG